MAIFLNSCYNFNKIQNNLLKIQNITTNGRESTGAKIWEGNKTTFNIIKTTSGIIYNIGKQIISFLGNSAFS